MVVEGYFLPPHTPHTRPTVLDVLGPEYAPRDGREVHIDDTVLEDDEVEEKADILREGEMEKRRMAEQADPANGDRAPNAAMLLALSRIEELGKGMNPKKDMKDYLREARSGAGYGCGDDD